MAVSFTYTTSDYLSYTFTPTGVASTDTVNWDFGDGTTSTSTGTTAKTHTYSTAASRTVSVAVGGWDNHTTANVFTVCDNKGSVYLKKAGGTTFTKIVDSNQWGGGQGWTHSSNPSWAIEPGDTLVLGSGNYDATGGFCFYYINAAGLMFFPNNNTGTPWRTVFGSDAYADADDVTKIPTTGWLTSLNVMTGLMQVNMPATWTGPGYSHPPSVTTGSRAFRNSNDYSTYWHGCVVPAYDTEFWYEPTESAAVILPVISISSNNNTSVTLSYEGLPPGATTIDWADDSGTTEDGTQVITVPAGGTGTVTHDYVSATVNFFGDESAVLGANDVWGEFDAPISITDSNSLLHDAGTCIGISINSDPVGPSSSSASIWKNGSTALSNNRGIVVLPGESVAFSRVAVTGYDLSIANTNGDGVITLAANKLSGTMTVLQPGYATGVENSSVTMYYTVQGDANTNGSYVAVESGLPTGTEEVSVSDAQNTMNFKDTTQIVEQEQKFSEIRNWFRSYASDNDSKLNNTGDLFSLGQLRGCDVMQAHIFIANETAGTYYNYGNARLAVYVDGGKGPWTISLKGITDSFSETVVISQPRVIFTGLNGTGDNTTNYKYTLEIQSSGPISPTVHEIQVQTSHGSGIVYCWTQGTANGNAQTPGREGDWAVKQFNVMLPINKDAPNSGRSSGLTPGAGTYQGTRI